MAKVRVVGSAVLAGVLMALGSTSVTPNSRRTCDSCAARIRGVQLTLRLTVPDACVSGATLISGASATGTLLVPQAGSRGSVTRSTRL